MALTRLLFMAAKFVASNPTLRKEAEKVATSTYTKAKPYVKKANENLQKAANEAAKKAPPDKDIYKFMGSFVGTIKKKMKNNE